MKLLKTIFISCCLMGSLKSSAQKTTSPAEIPYSNKIELNDLALEKLFQSQANVSVELGPGFRLEGTIQHRSDPGNALKTLLIHVSSKPGGTLSLSRYKDPEGHIFYAGHLMKLHEPDGMVLVENDNHYYLVETEQRFLVSE
jgi:hypothetical protein